MFSQTLRIMTASCRSSVLSRATYLFTPQMRSISTTQLNLNKFKTTTIPSNLSTNMKSPLRYKARALPHKKRLIPGKDAWSVVGYATADSYDLYSLTASIHQQGLYEVVPLEDELASVCLCVTAKYNVDEDDKPAGMGKDIYFFSDGTVVFWNIPELERDTVLAMLRKELKVEQDPYDEEEIFNESEMMNFRLLEGADKPAGNKSTHLDAKGVIQLLSPNLSSQQYRDQSLLLEQYAFSNAIASSVKLGMLEASLDKLIDSIEFLTEDLKSGRDVKMSQSEVLKKSGEIFALRHVVNLSSDLLDTPDFYWDRENLENLFHVTCSHLAIGKRTRVLNEKITHLCELMELIRTHLSDKHHVRLEWFIIALIWESLPDEAFIKRDILCLNPKHVRPYLFKTNDVEGRYLIASRDIKAGEAILREVPLSKGPQFSTKPVCLTCYKWTNGKYVCKKCGWPLCGPDCQKNPGDHDIECKIFQQKSVKVDSSTFKFSSGGEPLYDVIPPIRALALRDKDPESWKLFFNLMSHCDNWMTDPEWKKSHQYIIDYILNTLKIENVTEKMILTLFGIFYTNDFSTRIDNGQSPDNQPIGFTKLRLCFALISICSHDCVPNAIYDIVKEGDPAEFNIILKAKNNIKTGEKILISYVDILLPTYIRQKTLLESKKFLCQCERCKDPTSLGTYGDALLCQKCKFDQKNNKGVLLKSNTGIRKCNQCDWEQAESDIESILDAIHREADLLLNNPKLNQVDLFEKFIKKHQKTLHPNHMFLCLVKYSLSGFYGRLPGYEMHEMTPETVSRKQQICEETLKVIEKIEPGVGVRKGMLMYELHMPLIMMTQMKYQSGSVDKDSAKKNFKKAIKYLKEALDILKLEPEGTFEKNVYHGAKNSIEPLQNFVNSI